MTTQTNQSLSDDETLFYNLVWVPLVTTFQAWLLAEVPILAAPVIGSIVKAAISTASTYFFNFIRLEVDVTAVKFINSARQSAYDDASIKLKIIQQTEGVDSDAYKTALQNAITAQIALTRVSQ